MSPYDELADFVHDHLCPTEQLRQDLEDVQLHPVKKTLFIKFRTEESRNVVADKLSGDGLEWPEFHTKVQGWAMDKPVVFIRILGASPESSQQDIRGVMEQYGEVIEVKKGFLSRKLPNVTNGTWSVRMIVGVDKTIPSFVFVSADGEIWQIAHDNQQTICWKCGNQGHIGSRCFEQAVSIEADLLPAGDVVQGGAVPPPVQTWAHVVRGGGAQLRAGADDAAARGVKEAAAAKTLEEANTAKALEEANAAKVLEEANAAKIVEETKAAKAREEAKAAKAVEEAKAAKAVEEANAAKAVEEAKAAKAVEEANAAENAAATQVVGEASAAKTAEETVVAKDAVETVAFGADKTSDESAAA